MIIIERKSWKLDKMANFSLAELEYEGPKATKIIVCTQYMLLIMITFHFRYTLSAKF